MDHRILVDPSLDYQQFWNELGEELGRGAKGSHREEWKKAKLELPLTIESWRAYKSDYMLAAHKFEDRS